MLSDEQDGFYRQQLFQEIQELRCRGGLPNEAKFSRFLNVNDRKDTGEHFFIPVANKAEQSEHNGEAGLSPGMEFSAGRDGLTLPITPVLRSERAAILGLIASLSSNNTDSSRSSINQHTACNFETAAANWNKRCMDELQKPFEQIACF